MASTYKVEFILEDWMIKGLGSGKYMIKSGNLLKAQSHKVVKWLNVKDITPPEKTREILANAAAKLDIASISSVANLALSVAIYHRLGTMEKKIDQSIDQLRLLLDRVNEINDELLRGNTLYPIMTGFELLQRAKVSSNPEHLLKDAQVNLVKGMTVAAHWLQTKSCDALLEHFASVAVVSAALVKAAIIEAQAIRMLEKSPTENELGYPFEKARGVIAHIEQELGRAKVSPSKSNAMKGRGYLSKLRNCNDALVNCINESLNWQLALSSGEADLIKIDSSNNKAICNILQYSPAA